MRVYTGDNGMGLALRPPTGLPQARTRIYRGANRSRGVGQATAPGGCLLRMPHSVAPPAVSRGRRQGAGRLTTGFICDSSHRATAKPR